VPYLPFYSEPVTLTINNRRIITEIMHILTMSSAFSFLLRTLHPVPFICINLWLLNLYNFSKKSSFCLLANRDTRGAVAYRYTYMHMQLRKNHINYVFVIFYHTKKQDKKEMMHCLIFSHA